MSFEVVRLSFGEQLGLYCFSFFDREDDEEVVKRSDIGGINVSWGFRFFGGDVLMLGILYVILCTTECCIILCR